MIDWAMSKQWEGIWKVGPDSRGASNPTGDWLTLAAEAGDRREQEPWVSRGSCSGLGQHCRKPLGIHKKRSHVILCHWWLVNHSLPQMPHLEAVVRALSGQCARELQSGHAAHQAALSISVTSLLFGMRIKVRRWVSEGFQGLLFVSKKGHAWGFPCCAPGTSLPFVLYSDGALRRSHLAQVHICVWFGQHKVGQGSVFKTELRLKNETPGFFRKN